MTKNVSTHELDFEVELPQFDYKIYKWMLDWDTQ